MNGLKIKGMWARRGKGGGEQEQGRETEVHACNHNFEKLNGYKMEGMWAGTEGG